MFFMRAKRAAEATKYCAPLQQDKMKLAGIKRQFYGVGLLDHVLLRQKKMVLASLNEF